MGACRLQLGAGRKVRPASVVLSWRRWRSAADGPVECRRRGCGELPRVRDQGPPSSTTFSSSWSGPPLGFQETNSPLVIGVVGRGAHHGRARRRGPGPHPQWPASVVKTVATPEDAQTAHLVFFCASEDKRLDDLLPALAGSGILTVGESAAFAKQGGMIKLRSTRGQSCASKSTWPPRSGPV